MCMEFRNSRGHFRRTKEENLNIKKKKKEKELIKATKRKERYERQLIDQR